MEDLSAFLKPYQNVIGFSAGLCRVLQNFSGILVCYDILKKKSVVGQSVLTFLGGGFITYFSMLYGILLENAALTNVNLIGFLLNVIYTIFFYFYSSKDLKKTILKQIGITVGILAIVTGYFKFENPSEIKFKFGLILTITIFTLIGLPLLKLPKIIRTKTNDGIPLPILGSALVTLFMWLLYGICLNNILLVIQNTIAFILLGIQLILHVIYPSAGKIKIN